MSRLEALVAELAGAEGDAVLRHGVEAALPHERHVAGVGRGQAPGEEGADCIAAHCAHLLCQLVCHGGEVSCSVRRWRRSGGPHSFKLLMERHG